MTNQKLIKGLQTYPERRLVTIEGRTPLTEEDFVKHHHSLFPGEPIPELTKPWYNPGFARVKYVPIPAAEERPVVGSCGFLRQAF